MGLMLIVLWVATAVPAIDDLLLAQLDRRRRLRDRLGWRPQPVAFTALVVVIVMVPAIRSTIWHAPQRTRAVIDVPSARSPLGYAVPGAPAPGVVADLKTVLDTYAPRNAPFFDMTNSPGYFYYLLGSRPASRFTNVSLAIPEPAQRLLIESCAEAGHRWSRSTPPIRASVLGRHSE